MQRPVVVLDYRLSPGAYVLLISGETRRAHEEFVHGGTKVVYHLSQCGSRCRYTHMPSPDVIIYLRVRERGIP